MGTLNQPLGLRPGLGPIPVLGLRPVLGPRPGFGLRLVLGLRPEILLGILFSGQSGSISAHLGPPMGYILIFYGNLAIPCGRGRGDDFFGPTVYSV